MKDEEKKTSKPQGKYANFNIFISTTVITYLINSVDNANNKKENYRKRQRYYFIYENTYNNKSK